MIKTIVWIIVIWVVISFMFSGKKGEGIDWEPFKAEFKHHPWLIVIAVIILFILFF